MVTQDGKIYCDNCGAELERNTTLCSSCGKQVDQFGSSSVKEPFINPKTIIIAIVIVIIAIILFNVIRDAYIHHAMQKAIVDTIIEMQ